MLHIKDLYTAVDNKKILEGLNLSVNVGEVHAIMGPNGSGKSTLLRVLIGLLPPAQGTISINGKLANYESTIFLKELRNQMTIVFQQ